MKLGQARVAIERPQIDGFCNCVFDSIELVERVSAGGAKVAAEECVAQVGGKVDCAKKILRSAAECKLSLVATHDHCSEYDACIRDMKASLGTK
eukprot:11534816-Alexandrium_andersonii.AAC.1